jgi:hypothetical protein
MLKLEISVIFLVSLSSHAQVFQGEVTLLMNVAVVVLRYFGSRNVVFRPSTFYS